MGLPEGHAETPSSDPGPLGAVLDDEAKRVLDAAVAGLPAEQRAVFVLRAVEEMSYAEIAESLGLSPGTVMSRLFRPRERLARALGPYLGRAAERRVAFLPGSLCFAQEPATGYMRLSFSYATPAEIREGVVRLSRAVRDAREGSARTAAAETARPMV